MTGNTIVTGLIVIVLVLVIFVLLGHPINTR